MGIAWLEWLALLERELLLFAGTFFLLGAIDELCVDAAWIRLKLTGRAKTARISRALACEASLSGPAAVLVPTWQEDRVIDRTIEHMLAAWPQAELRIFVGVYRNDPATARAVIRGAHGDPRVRLRVYDKDGPTTKADCLNHLYASLEAEEQHTGVPFRSIILHDAEDMVDPAALPLLDTALHAADFVQIPVLPEAQPASRWIGSHYCEEFAEAHGKSMVVREALSVGLPAAGVGCAFSRTMMGRMAEPDGLPFSTETLTEDYELGMRIKAAGGRAHFLRARGEDGALVATRACFPMRIDQAVRQKARWIHGISLQGWDRLGWSGGLGETWMRLRDRRGPLTAFVLAAAYALLLLAVVLWTAEALGHPRPWQLDPVIRLLVILNFASFAWRAVWRFGFTAREYGWKEGVRAVLRIPLANVIAILAGRRAFFAYLRTLRGESASWDKTAHHALPPAMLTRRAA